MFILFQIIFMNFSTKRIHKKEHAERQKNKLKQKKTFKKNIKSQKTQVPECPTWNAISCASSSIHTCKHYIHERKKICITHLTKTKLPWLSLNLKFRFSSHYWHKYCNSICNAFLQNDLNYNFKHGVSLLNGFWRCFPFYEAQSVCTFCWSFLQIKTKFRFCPFILTRHIRLSRPVFFALMRERNSLVFPEKETCLREEGGRGGEGREDEDVKVNGRWRLIFFFSFFFRYPSPRLHETAHIQPGLIKCQPEPPTV